MKEAEIGSLIPKYKQKLDANSKKELINGYRDIEIGSANSFFEQNSISTTKYTYFNFIFKNLYEQYTKIANIYFLILAALQMIRTVSITEGLPTILPPLAFITFLTMIKDFFEDYKRRKSDAEENNKKTMVYKQSTKKWVEELWKNVLVGDIVKVNKNEFFPCDLLCLASSDYRKGQCFIETKNLDGETNLKNKFTPTELKETIKDESSALALQGNILNCEGPNQYLSKFKGSMIVQGNKVPLSASNFLLRGCILRNTDYIIGLATYTGHQTKIMKNSISARPKKSSLETATGHHVVITFILLVFFCFFSGTIYGIWESQNQQMLTKYMLDAPVNMFAQIFIKMGNWILLFGNFVPISLMLTLETVKFMQGNLMSIDQGLVSYHGIPCKVQSSNLNEELGQIDYVFSDKTGTLTCNEMVFKYLIIGKTVYGEKTGYNGNVPTVQNVSFSDPRVWQKQEDGFSGKDGQALRNAIMLLGLCHTVVLEKNGDYNASSPDELAFSYFAKLVGAEFLGMDEDNNIVLDEFGTQKKYILLEVFEFNSDRKRMSAIVQSQEDGKIFLYCKGADSIMIPRYHPQKKPYFDEVMLKVEEFAAIGLRTLLLGRRELSQQQYNEFKQEYDDAKNNLEKRSKLMRKCQDKWETELELVGATAIEDRLQDEVPETIEYMRLAGIKVWVLTGDKVDTAKNIGYSCRLLVHEGMKLAEYDKDVEVEHLLESTKKLREQQLKDIDAGFKIGFLVTGHLLDTILSKDYDGSELKRTFTQIALDSNVVLCCRVSPKQKQEIVAMVKQELPDKVTLGIGDGANDVNMITEAHVGIGIKGLEGAQAARASDFAIGEFKLLRRLLFFHGRESYRKNANLILYNFYKNILLCLPQFWYGFTNWFSGQTLYEKINFQFFNILYTSLPIILYALFDRQTSDIILMSDPNYYQMGPKRLLFNVKRFLMWFGTAAFEGLLLIFGGLALFDEGFATRNGHVFGFWVFGMAIFHGVVMLSSLKLISMSSSFSPLVIIAFIASYALFLVAWWLVAKMDVGVLESTFYSTWSHVNIWLFTLFIIGISFGDYAVQKIVDELYYKEYIPPASVEDFKVQYGLTKQQEQEIENRTAMNRYARSYTESLSDRLLGKTEAVKDQSSA